MEQVAQVCYNIARAMQLGGVACATVFLCIAGFQFMTGGRNAKEIGKGTIIGVCIGLGCIGGCEVLAKWIEGIMTF